MEFDGDDHVWFAGDSDRVLDEIESFLTAGRSAPPSNRVLSIVLFTDIVGSTERAAPIGDEAWSTALAAHNCLVERHVTGARGAVVKFTGDDALATFDGPARAINCACAIRDAVEDLGLTIRAGLHTGEVEMADGMCTASRYTSPRASWRSPRRARCSCQARSRHWCWDLGSHSPSAAATNSRACRTGGRPRGARRPCLTRSGPTNGSRSARH